MVIFSLKLLHAPNSGRKKARVVRAGGLSMSEALVKQAEQWETRAKRRIVDAQSLYQPESMEYRAMLNGAMIYRNCAEEVRALVQASSSTHPSATQEVP